MEIKFRVLFNVSILYTAITKSTTIAEVRGICFVLEQQKG